jgi:galactokinase
MHISSANLFQQVFLSPPDIIVQSPGRINIIGEHIDYNEGFVLPAAIDKFIFISVQKREDNVVSLFSTEFNEHYETCLNNLSSKKGHWSDYILGVLHQLLKEDYHLTGFNAVVDGSIPIGAGLSSSAAVECAAIYALNELFELGLSKIELVKIAQKAEHEFAGVMCGIMDMFTSVFGKNDYAIRLDCRSFEHEYIPLNLHAHKLVLFNTNVKHNLSSSAYNERRQQCEQGVAWIKEYEPYVHALRDVTIPMLNKHVLSKDPVIYRRCRYVVEENTRLLMACEDLENGHLLSLGRKMFATHDGLSNDYEVSCTELDLLIQLVKNNNNVLGARMMGGGFGGCTINLVKENAIEQLVNEVSEAYHTQTGLECSHYIVSIANGTSVIKTPSGVLQ